MTSHRRHGLPRKKPGTTKQAEIEAELPTLEPLDDDLPTLEPIEDEGAAPADDGPVKVVVSPGSDASFELEFAVEVPAMEKKAVADAVKAPLQRAAQAQQKQLRHHRALVRFHGEALIGTAVKDLVGELLKPHKPRKVVVRRGYGDEVVCEGSLPQVKVEAATNGAQTDVVVATGDLESVDLGLALQPQLADLALQARGKRFALQFTGAAKPDAAVREQIRGALQGAGALRVAIGARVLFDLELANRVQVTKGAQEVAVAIDPAGEESATLDALAMVLPEHAPAMAGKVVRLTFSKAPRTAELAFAVETCRKFEPQRIESSDPAVTGDVVWPKLLRIEAGSETKLEVVASTRSRAALAAAFRRECAEHTAVTKGKVVVVDWPAEFALDAEIETACLQPARDLLQPKALACTIGGERREPFFPEAVTCSLAGEQGTIRIDTDAGKPAELQRAFERRFPAVQKTLPGKAVRVQMVGAAATSRTLLRTICGAIEAAGAMRLEVEDRGAIDVVLPAMLTVTRHGADAVRIAAVVGGRDAAQQAAALQRELDAADLPKGASVTIAPGATADAVVAAVLARGAARIVLDGAAPVQVHPPLFGKAEKKGPNVTLRAAPGGDAAMVALQAERELPLVLAAAGELANTTVTLVWPGAADPLADPVAKVVQAFAGKKAGKVLLDRGTGKAVQVHPSLAPAPAPKPPAPAPAAPAAVAAPLSAPPAPAAAATPAAAGAALVTVLGRRDEAVPPIVLLGVADGEGDAHGAAVQQALQPHLDKFRGRCVMVVLRAGDQDVPVRREVALLAVLRQTLPQTAAATLVFRGPDAQGRPHFQVLHSTLRALPVGGAFADPRAKR
jgi:hypothetical protein